MTDHADDRLWIELAVAASDALIALEQLRDERPLTQAEQALEANLAQLLAEWARRP